MNYEHHSRIQQQDSWSQSRVVAVYTLLILSGSGSFLTMLSIHYFMNLSKMNRKCAREWRTNAFMKRLS